MWSSQFVNCTEVGLSQPIANFFLKQMQKASTATTRLRRRLPTIKVCAYFTKVQTECGYVLWFKLYINLFNAGKYVCFGVYHVPPDATFFS